MKKVARLIESLLVLSALIFCSCDGAPVENPKGDFDVKEEKAGSVYYYIPTTKREATSAEIEEMMLSSENNEETEDESDSAIYIEETVTPEYGIIFYLGTIISPGYYRNLASILASKGYIVCMPENLFAYIQYSSSQKSTDEILEAYPDTKFFLAGHSQGGGAATKMTNENREKYLGTMLLSPLSYSKDSFADSEIPTLFFQAENDKCLSDKQKAESKTTLPENTEMVYLEGCNHMGYSSMTIFSDVDVLNLNIMDGNCTIGVEEQQKLVAQYMLDFMENVLAK